MFYAVQKAIHHSKRRQSPMRKNLMTSLISFITVLFLLTVQQALAQGPPDGVLALRPGGYAFADYPDMLNALADDGITIEAWFYLTDVPSEWREHCILISKPGSYAITMRGRGGVRHISPYSEDPDGTIYMDYKIYTSPEGSGCRSEFHLSPESIPLNRWVHIGYQLKGLNPIQNAELYDGQVPSSGTCGGSRPLEQPPGPLFIGGADGYDSFKGWIDEVRISNTWRYAPGTLPDIPAGPSEEFRKDRHTIALWHFDEGPWAYHYADDSGNGYTLFSGGTLRVNKHNDRLTTTWGQLKSADRASAITTARSECHSIR
jgi:hypothetical protein